jgi:membrane peptidoglycan carboxypeptidase
MTDMATLYSTFANLGETVALDPFVEIKDAKGTVLYHNPCIESNTPCNGRRTLDARIAYQITNILSDNQARSQAFGLHSVLDIPGQQVAVKTGTTNGLRDNWTFGYTTNRLIAVWVGNNDNSPMSRVTSGITGASPIWNSLMKTQLPPLLTHIFAIPNNLHTTKVCPYTGKVDCGNCSGAYAEFFLPGTEPNEECVQALEQPSPRTDVVSGRRDRILEGVTIQ